MVSRRGTRKVLKRRIHTRKDCKRKGTKRKGTKRKGTTCKDHPRHRGAGSSAHLLASVEAVCQRIFSAHEIQIEEVEDDLQVQVMCEDKGSVVFTLSAERIYVDLLSLCPPDQTGSDVMRGILSVARELGIPEVYLHDASVVYITEYDNPQCGVSLFTLKILTSPEHRSWYGSFGFRSEMDEEERRANRALAESPLMDRVFPVYVKGKRMRAIKAAKKESDHRIWLLNDDEDSVQEELRDLKKRLKEIEKYDWARDAVEDIEDAFPGLTALSVGDAIRVMVADRRSWDSCDHPRARVFIELMWAAEELVEYNPVLVHRVAL